MNVGIHKIPQHTTCLEAALLLAKSELIGGGEKYLGTGRTVFYQPGLC